MFSEAIVAVLWGNKENNDCIPFHGSFQLYLIDGNGFEPRQTSKEQTKMPRFRLESPLPCTIFCFALIHYACTINTFLLVSSSVRSKQLLCFVHGQGQKRKQKPTTKKLVGFHNRSPLLTMFQLHCKILNKKSNGSNRTCRCYHREKLLSLWDFTSKYYY